MNSVLLTLALAAGSPVVDPLDPVAPKGPVDPADPSGRAPDAPPPADAPAAPDEARAGPAPDPRPQAPLGPAAVAALQLATGCAVVAALVPLGILCTTLTLLGGPLVVGYFETWAGDRFGGERAPAIVPIVTAYVGAGVSALAGGGVLLALALSGTTLDLAAPAGVAVAGVGLSLTMAALPISYALTAVPKHPLDDGVEPPDFLAPRVPARVSPPLRRPPAPGTT